MLLVALILQSLPAHSCFFLLEDDNSTRGENRSSKISLLSRIVPILKKNENFNFPGLLAVGGGGAPLSAFSNPEYFLAHLQIEFHMIT